MLRNNIKLLAVFYIFFMCIEDAHAQDPSFSQFYANPLYLNPAFAGSNECPRANLNYRDQWPGIGRTYVTTSVSWDNHLDAIGGGVGLLVAQDRAGDGNLNMTHIALQYSYRLKINSQFAVKAGFEAAYRSLELNWGSLTFGDMIDPQLGFVYPTQEDIYNNPSQKGFTDFSTGILGYSENLFFGLAMHHLTQPNQGFMRLLHYDIHINYM
jgi:type IX secretion system PorP/SprF family membrane protein